MDRLALARAIIDLADALEADGLPMAAEQWRELVSDVTADELRETRAGGQPIIQRGRWSLRPAFLWGIVVGVLACLAARVWLTVLLRWLGESG